MMTLNPQEILKDPLSTQNFDQSNDTSSGPLAAVFEFCRQLFVPRTGGDEEEEDEDSMLLVPPPPSPLKKYKKEEDQARKTQDETADEDHMDVPSFIYLGPFEPHQGLKHNTNTTCFYPLSSSPSSPLSCVEIDSEPDALLQHSSRTSSPSAVRMNKRTLSPNQQKKEDQNQEDQNQEDQNQENQNQQNQNQQNQNQQNQNQQNQNQQNQLLNLNNSIHSLPALQSFDSLEPVRSATSPLTAFGTREGDFISLRARRDFRVHPTRSQAEDWSLHFDSRWNDFVLRNGNFVVPIDLVPSLLAFCSACLEIKTKSKWARIPNGMFQYEDSEVIVPSYLISDLERSYRRYSTI